MRYNRKTTILKCRGCQKTVMAQAARGGQFWVISRLDHPPKGRRIPIDQEYTCGHCEGGNRPSCDASDLCFIGAAEAMKYGSYSNSKQVRSSDLDAAATARTVFKCFDDQQMAVALLILMVDLGKRIYANDHSIS